MRSRKILVSIVVSALIILMASSTVSACRCRKPGKSPGYWKHNVRVYVEEIGSYSGTPKETDWRMEYYEGRIQSRIGGWFSLEWANNFFQDNQNKDQWLWLANLFNWAAHRAPYYG